MYTINPVQEEDIPKLAKVMSVAFTKADAEKPWDEEHSFAYLEYWFKKQSDMFFVAFDESGNPIGAIAGNIKPWRTGARLNDVVIFVEVNNQQKGVAIDLIKKIIQEALDKYNATMVEAITFAGEEFPLTWYKKLGVMPDEHAVIIKGDCKEILSKLS